MTVLDRVAKTKGAFAFEKVQVPYRASRFCSPLRLALLRLPPPANDCGFYNQKEEEKKKIAVFPGKAGGERLGARQSFSTSGVLFLPRQVIRCPHLADNEATVGPIVSALDGMLNEPTPPTTTTIPVWSSDSAAVQE